MKILILPVLALATVATWAADWPAWTGPQGLNISSETGLPEAFDRDTGTNVKWATKLGTVLYGCPTVSRGRIFVGTNYPAVDDDDRFTKPHGGVVACLDEKDGKILWKLVVPDRQWGYPEGFAMTQEKWGICSSPTVDGDRVYVVDNGGNVLCLDVNGLADGNDGPFQDEASYMVKPGQPPIKLLPTDADIIWCYDVSRELGVCPHDVASCSVLIIGNVLYTSTSNGVGREHEIGCHVKTAPGFMALDKQTGRLLAVEDDQLCQRIYHTQWSSPSVGNVNGGKLIFLGGGDGWCYAFTPVSDKKSKTPQRMVPVWRYNCLPHHYVYNPDGSVIPYYNGDVRKYKKRKRKKEDTTGWNSGDGSFLGPSQIIATPVFHENRIYVAIGQDPAHGLGRGMLHCIDATKKGDITESGRIWSYDAIGRTICTVSIADSLVYATDLDGKLHCLDADTGKVHWVHDAGDECWAGPLIADGKIYLITRQTFTTLAEGREKKVLFTDRGGSECSPIAANGVLYVFTKNHLHALAEGASRQH
ncbi:MAG: PQQ-binding-like beta-propeller repeat protein [Kiritimatiellales bacterium]|nr:PQQ-binding-like beta-propeller repeat protein [Kiritimatiellales bacterium]